MNDILIQLWNCDKSLLLRFERFVNYCKRATVYPHIGLWFDYLRTRLEMASGM